VRAWAACGQKPRFHLLEVRQLSKTWAGWLNPGAAVPFKVQLPPAPSRGQYKASERGLLLSKRYMSTSNVITINCYGTFPAGSSPKPATSGVTGKKHYTHCHQSPIKKLTPPHSPLSSEQPLAPSAAVFEQDSAFAFP